VLLYAVWTVRRFTVCFFEGPHWREAALGLRLGQCRFEDFMANVGLISDEVTSFRVGGKIHWKLVGIIRSVL
jgi:hypothetical protein